jgi:hypothetical protein
VVARFPERIVIFAVLVATVPESVAREPESELTVLVRVMREPERVSICVWSPETVHERAF